MNRLIDWLKTDIFLLRTSGVGCLVLTFLAAGVVFVALGLENDRMSHRKTTPEIATIIGFGVYEGRWHPGDFTVTGRDSKGRTDTILVQPSLITGCHVGDKIRAASYGLVLYLYPEPCPITLDPDEVEKSPGK